MTLFVNDHHWLKTIDITSFRSCLTACYVQFLLLIFVVFHGRN